MERVSAIWNHPGYQACVQEIQKWEADREFCRHTPEHFLAVARITWILALENGLPADRELVYAAGLLHDIGRHIQYSKGIPHEKAGAELAESILRDCGFTDRETEQVLELILNHRTRQGGTDLPSLFYRADKLSRDCFSCPARVACDWPEDRKNLKIRY